MPLLRDAIRAANGARDRERPHDRAPWPCRYCQARDTVVITWRDAVMLVCFCEACEQGWRATAHGQPKD
jgi:hypothetical protein